MSDIVQIIGRVKHSITLDPSIWIFDDRKKRLEEFFATEDLEDDQSVYVENMAKLWDKTIKEGVTPTSQSEKLFVEKKDISGDWAIPFKPFVQNAEPHGDAQSVICHMHNGEKREISLAQAKDSILCFALDGKPIRGEDGPIHLYFRDSSNVNAPIKGIQSFEIR